MKRKLVVWVTEGERIVFEDVSMAWMDGNRLLFHTSASVGTHPCGINTTEVLAWEFVKADGEAA